MNPLSAEQADREKTALWDGVRTCAPAVPGLLAWGAVTGMVLVQSGLSIWQATAMTLIVYAGSAQLATLPLIIAGAPIWVIVLTALLVNFRFVIFSAVVGPHFAHLHWTRRLWYGFFNADLVMAFFPQRFPVHTMGKPGGKLGYFKGLAYCTWWAWEIGSLIGIVLASQIPTNWGIGFAGTLVLLGMTIPLIVNLATLAGVLVASAISVTTTGIPYKLGLVLAIFGGIAAAVVADRMVGSSSDSKESTS
jgi:predicted branched-subunit amino acid permease